MENPLISSDQGGEKPEAAPAQAPAPAPVAPQSTEQKEPESKEVKAKKPFFTTGKILAIFAALIVIAAIVGAIIYSQSSQRFQGAAQLADTTTEKTADTTTRIGTSETIISQTTAPTTGTRTSSGMLDLDTQAEPIGSITTITTDTTVGQCNEDLGLVLENDTCVCDTERGFVDNPNSEIISTNRVTALNELINPCICADDTLFNPESNACEVVDLCDLTDEELKMALENEFTSASMRAEIELLFRDREAYCPPETTETVPDDSFIEKVPDDSVVERVPDDSVIERVTPVLTCSDYINDFKTAYNERDWEKFKASLQLMIDNKCITSCQANLYWTIFYLHIDQVGPALKTAKLYKDNCPDCNSQFEFLAVVAQVISDIDQEKQEAGEILSVDYLKYVQDIAIDYINSCQCIEIEAFLDNPIFNVADTFPASREVKTTDTGLDSLLNTRETTKTLSYVKDDVLVIAYAQSSSLSPSVTSTLEKIVMDMCEEPEEPVNCSLLEIVSPSSGDMEISEDFDSATDTVEFNVTGTDNVANYRVSASNDSLVFDGQDSNIYTDLTSVSLDGGPTVDDPVDITVEAIEVTGRPLPECTDTITISRAPTPPDRTPTPVCRSLNIVSPPEANQAGEPSFYIPAGGFVDEPLTVEIDGDQGSWSDLIYRTASGHTDISFNGDSPLTTDALTVLMSGRPTTSNTETIEVVALDPSTQRPIDSCSDSFTIIIDTDTPPSLSYTPPEEEDEPPSLSYTPPEEEDEPPSLSYTPPEEVPTEPQPVSSTPPVYVEEPPTRLATTVEPFEQEPSPGYVSPTTTALHAAPATPQTGPGLIVPLVGIALGGAWMRRKRK